MQENNTDMLNREFTFIKQTKEKELLVACYKLIYCKLRKLQIANIKVTSLA
jgi:hypothetical protein